MAARMDFPRIKRLPPYVFNVVGDLKLEARRRGEDIVIAPDGPRGPRRRAKEGVVQLARATGLPVVAVGLAAEPVRRLGSWDRLQLPRPFARAVVVLGAPVALPADKDAALAALEEALARVDAEATALASGAAS